MSATASNIKILAFYAAEQAFAKTVGHQNMAIFLFNKYHRTWLYLNQKCHFAQWIF